jgi:hypothetical protein
MFEADQTSSGEMAHPPRGGVAKPRVSCSRTTAGLPNQQSSGTDGKSHPRDGVVQAIAPAAIRTKGRKLEKTPTGM